jgi:dienelactone hydrolase
MVLGLTASLLSACSSAPSTPSSFAVGVFTQTFSRLGPPVSTASGVNRTSAMTRRTLPTTIFYPATGTPAASAVSGATPDARFGPYPLIVFAPGFGTAPDLAPYPKLLERWAAAGYVVAAVTFPFTSSNSPGGPNLEDFANQPADMSAVTSGILADSRGHGTALAGLVDAHHIGAAGHSLGGVTVLGLVANTCCRDRRISAAVVMSGDAIAFPTGTRDPSAAPPMLFVHGNADPTVPYVSSVDAFNAARGPKGLLTVLGGDHGAPVDPTGRAFSSVVSTTTDFFDAYLKHDTAAAGRLPGDAKAGITTLAFTAVKGSKLQVARPPVPVTHLHATVTPDSALHDGQTVTVSWSGYAPGQSVNALECSHNPPTAAGQCDLTSGVLLHPDPTGSATVSLVVHTGVIGTGGGICDATHPCVIAVNQGGSLAASATATVEVTFASS